MSHAAQMEFISRLRNAFPAFFDGNKVLEIGSLDINGSVRSHFRDCDYTGLDIGPGPGVDVVCPGQDYRAPDASFDTVVSCECMEHNPYWQETFLNMARMARPGGLVVMSCATTGRAEHGTARSDPGSSPLTIERGWNYYRNLTASDFRRKVDIGSLFSAAMFCTNINASDLYFVGIRAGARSDGAEAERLKAFRKSYLRTVHAHPRAALRYTAMRIFGEHRVRALKKVLRLIRPPQSRSATA